MPDDLQDGADVGLDADPSQGGEEAGADAGEMTARQPDADVSFMDAGAVPAELQDHFKRMQASFTRAMQGVRAEKDGLGQLKQKAALVDRFYADRAYALQTLQHLAPQLGFHLVPQGTPAPGTPGASPSSSTGELAAELQQTLPPDLAFLAGPLGQAFEKVLSERVAKALQPYGDQIRQQSEAARRTERERVLAEVDGKYPGWDTQYGDKLAQLEAFLGSDQLAHPQFGSKVELLLKLVNPDLARVDAIQGMQRASQNRTSAGRTGRQASPNFSDQLRQTNRDKGWNAAWDLAMQNLELLSRASEEGTR